jgi:hypothetical protein
MESLTWGSSLTAWPGVTHHDQWWAW